MESVKEKKEEKNGRWPSLSKNRDIKKTPQVDSAEHLSTPGIPISAYQYMFTPRAPRSRENLHVVLESLRSMKMYGETLSWRTVLWRRR